MSLTNFSQKMVMIFILIGIVSNQKIQASDQKSFSDLVEFKKVLSKHKLTEEMTTDETLALGSDILAFKEKLLKKEAHHLFSSLVEKEYINFFWGAWRLSYENYESRKYLIEKGIELKDLSFAFWEYPQHFSTKSPPFTPTHYRNVFLKYDDALSFFKKNITYWEKEDKKKASKWKEELLKLSPDYFNRKLQSIFLGSYVKGAHDIGISDLHKLGFYGQDIDIAMLDATKFGKTSLLDYDRVKNDIISGSSPGLTDHSFNMLLGLAADPKTIYDYPSIAPLSSIFHYATKKWEHTLVGDKKNKTKVSKIVKDGMLVDIKLEDPEADLEIAEFFRVLREKNIKIVNISRDLLMGDISQKEIEAFVLSGGLIVLSLGNGGFEFKPNEIMSQLEYESADTNTKIAASQYPIVKFVHENQQLQKGFIFVGALKLKNDRKTYIIEDLSCRPGSLVSNRTLVAPTGKNGYYVDNGIDSYALTGTSGAAVFVTGTLALLQNAFPGATAQDIAQFLLDNATTMEPMDPKTYGQGMLNAKTAFRALTAKYSSN